MRALANESPCMHAVPQRAAVGGRPGRHPALATLAAMVVILSTYELGRPGFGPALAAAWLRDAGIAARLVDLSRGRCQPTSCRRRRCSRCMCRCTPPPAWPVRCCRVSVRNDPMRRGWRSACTRRSTPQWLRAHGATHVFGVEAEPALASLAAGQTSGDIDARGPRSPGWPSRCRTGPASCRCPPTRTSASTASTGSPDTRRHHVAVCTPAATARSCPSTRAPCASCRSRSCWPTSPSRCDAGARHITFGDPDFLNGPTHARRVLQGTGRATPRGDLRRDRQGRAPAGARRPARPDGRHPLCLRHVRRGGVRRPHPAATAEGTHGRRRAAGDRGCAGPAAWRWCRPSWPSRRGRRWRGYLASARRDPGLVADRSGRCRCSSRCACCCRRVRRCWPTPTSDASRRRSTRRRWRIPGCMTCLPSIACRRP